MKRTSIADCLRIVVPLAVSLLTGIASASAADKPANDSFSNVACEGLYPKHFQRICTSDTDSIFWCLTDELVETDRQGRVVKTVAVADEQNGLVLRAMPWVRVPTTSKASSCPIPPSHSCPGDSITTTMRRPPAGGLLGKRVAQGRGRFPGNEEAGGERGQGPSPDRQVHDRAGDGKQGEPGTAGPAGRPAEKTGIYLDITGLACYRKKDVPKWYDDLSEKDRWDVQARFWEAVAARCANSPAIFCYDLMNEPVVAGRARAPGDWLRAAAGGRRVRIFPSSSSRWTRRSDPDPRSPGSGAASW